MAAAKAIELKDSADCAGGATKYGETGLGTWPCFVCLVKPISLVDAPSPAVGTGPLIP